MRGAPGPSARRPGGPPGAGCRGRTHAELEADAARRPRADGKHRLGRVLAADGSDLEGEIGRQLLELALLQESARKELEHARAAQGELDDRIEREKHAAVSLNFQSAISGKKAMLLAAKRGKETYGIDRALGPPPRRGKRQREPQDRPGGHGGG